MRMTDCQTYRGPIAALALAATLIFGAGAASAATVQVTVDFGVDSGDVASPYVEDGFEVAGKALLLEDRFGNPPVSVALDPFTTSLTITRMGGGLFSLISFDYSCANGLCDFSVGSTPITGGSTALANFVTVSPGGYMNVASLVFTRNSASHLIDNIVLSYEQAAPVPLPAVLPLLLGGLAGLGLLARRKGRAA